MGQLYYRGMYVSDLYGTCDDSQVRITNRKHDAVMVVVQKVGGTILLDKEKIHTR